MTKKIVPTFAIAMVATFSVLGTWWLLRSQNVNGELPENLVITTKFFMSETFFSGDHAAQPPQETRRIIAAIVPHHLIAGKEISRVLKLLAAKGYGNVLLIGPNHYDAGPANILTASVDIGTPFGVQEGYQWIDYPAMAPELLEQEHSIMGLTPYLKYYLNGHVQIFVLKAKTPREELARFARAIHLRLDPNTIALFSVDFSHYLPKLVAEKNDALTAQALLAMDAEFIYSLNNDFLDSPPALMVMLTLCKMGGATFTILDHTNSADLVGQPRLISTTSHFTGYCAI